MLYTGIAVYMQKLGKKTDTNMHFKIKILHILPHAGGGVGTVLRAILTEEINITVYSHTIMSLDYLNKKTKEYCNSISVKWIDKIVTLPREKINGFISEADIVLVHWWNHPYIMQFLYNGLPPCRLLIWAHVNGFSPPQLFIPEIFEIPDFFIFSCRNSLEHQIVKELPNHLKKRLRIVKTSVRAPSESTALPLKPNLFQAGYIGTVEPIKMHQDFLKICSEVNLPTPYLVIGGNRHNELKEKAKLIGVDSRFEIIGPVDDPIPFFQRLHVFVYPLARHHYGTGEQVLLEAMAFGAVPIVLDNPPELEIVTHEETGLVASNPTEFTEAIRILYKNSKKRNKLVKQCYEFVSTECHIKKSIDALHNIFSESMNLKKRERHLHICKIAGISPGSPCHLFLSSIAMRKKENLLDSDEFLVKYRHNLIHPTKGTPFHYLKMLGRDEELSKICAKLSE
ncbi:MAG TPA: glycosyltransferase family 4 protein, partial [Victivallales bacterium]|nr:glycosyltransferase family 4 protein [Victivallales bacterium]